MIDKILSVVSKNCFESDVSSIDSVFYWYIVSRGITLQVFAWITRANVLATISIFKFLRKCVWSLIGNIYYCLAEAG